MNLLPIRSFSVTTAAEEACRKRNIDQQQLLNRHIRMDWGEMCEEDVKSNEEALEHKGFLQSQYTVDGVVLWVITDPGWNMTTLLLPSDY